LAIGRCESTLLAIDRGKKFYWSEAKKGQRISRCTITRKYTTIVLLSGSGSLDYEWIDIIIELISGQLANSLSISSNNFAILVEIKKRRNKKVGRLKYRKRSKSLIIFILKRIHAK